MKDDSKLLQEFNREELDTLREVTDMINLNAQYQLTGCNYKLYESFHGQLAILQKSHLPLLWVWLLNFSLAIMDSLRWKFYVEGGVRAWHASDRKPCGEMWWVLGKMLRRVRRDVVVERKGVGTGVDGREFGFEEGLGGGVPGKSGSRSCKMTLTDQKIFDRAFGALSLELEGDVWEEMDVV